MLVDEITDNSYVYWGKDGSGAGRPGRGWFTRYDRPVGQMLEIATISGNTVSFTTPLAHRLRHRAHRATHTLHDPLRREVRGGGGPLRARRPGRQHHDALRDVLLGEERGVRLVHRRQLRPGRFFRCVMRDSYVHDTADPYPGGAGYMLSVAHYTADSLVENNIFINGNKVMVMRASGGGNVIGYNYFDNGYIENYLGWMETGLNASHLTCPHFELFEGNQAFNIDGDDTWGGAVYNTFFRNHVTGKRRSYPDIDNRRAVGLMWATTTTASWATCSARRARIPRPTAASPTRTSTLGGTIPSRCGGSATRPRTGTRRRSHGLCSTFTGTGTSTTRRTPSSGRPASIRRCRTRST